MNEIICAISVTCALVGELELPFRYTGKPYDTTYACYIKGTFYRQCPGPPSYENYKLT